MKKLMILLATVAVAGLTQGATCSWASGKLRTAASKDGGWSSTTAKSASALVTMNIYLLDSLATYEDLAGLSQKALYDAYKGKSANLTGNNFDSSDSSYLSSITIEETSAYAGIQYGVAIATYKDATYGDMYIATRVATIYTSASNSGSAGNIISGVGDWQPVPEPTSAMLLMLGLCGLALKRKNA